MAVFRRVLMLVCLILADIVPALARDPIDAGAAQFDRPVTTQRLPPKSTRDPVGEHRCTYYKDFMIRETGTETPAPAAASLTPIGPANPLCDATGGLPLPTAGFSFLGRKGPFLFFRATSPNGAMPFLILNAADGRVIYADSQFGDGLRAASPKPASLDLHYTRGVNGSCSVYKEGPTCWARMLNEGKVPRVLALLQPPVQVCGTSYRKFNVPSNVPTLIYYDVHVTLQLSGKARVNARGAPSCAPVT